MVGVARPMDEGKDPFLLFQAGELLESRADEDLARRVKALLAAIEQG